MDKLDYLILSELLKDAASTFVEIAKKTETTPYTVRRRYEKMKKGGLIFSSIISIDLSKLGYQGKALLFISLTPDGNRQEVIAHLKKIRNVIVVTEIIGTYDILAIAPLVDLKSIQTIVKEAKKAPNVQRVELTCVDDVYFPVSPNLGTILSDKSKFLSEI